MIADANESAGMLRFRNAVVPRLNATAENCGYKSWKTGYTKSKVSSYTHTHTHTK